MQPDRARLVDEGDFQRELSDEGVPLVPGQEVIWNYGPQRPRRRPYPIAAEVAYVGSLRVRIRVRTASGKTLLRWVHPKNLRARVPGEAPASYPEPS